MERKEIEKKLREVIRAAKPEIAKEKIKSGLNLQEYGMDSIEIMQLVVEIEDEFDIEIGNQFFVDELLTDYDKLFEIIVSCIGE